MKGKLKLKIIISIYIFIFIQIEFNIIINNEIKIEKYLIICNSTKLIIKKFFKKIQKPKVSIISTVYNREKYLIRFINSIQNQQFNNFEMIFIDDSSDDNSIQIIEDFQRIDERILLIKNKKNKGTFICRNLGVLQSKGEYIILPDPDDIISRDIIYLSYKLAKRYNYEMIRFNIYLGQRVLLNNNIVQNLQSRPIYQPELSTYLFYGLGKLRQIDFFVSNKFVKRVSFIRALNCLNKYYLKLYMVYYEDGLMNFFLYRTVKSLYFLKKIGYYYIKNPKSIKEIQLKRTYFLKFTFIYLKFVFQFTKNTLLEKDMSNFLLRFIKSPNNYNKILSLNKDFNFYYDTINIYLKSKFINAKNKNYLKKLKYIIENKIKKKS